MKRLDELLSTPAPGGTLWPLDGDPFKQTLALNLKTEHNL